MEASLTILNLHTHTNKLGTSLLPNFSPHFILLHFVFVVFYVISLEVFRIILYLLAMAFISLKDLISLFDFFFAATHHLLLHHFHFHCYYCLCYRYYASFSSSFLNSQSGRRLLTIVASYVLKTIRNPSVFFLYLLLRLKDLMADFHPTDLIIIEASYLAYLLFYSLHQISVPTYDPQVPQSNCGRAHN